MADRAGQVDGPKIKYSKMIVTATVVSKPNARSVARLASIVAVLHPGRGIASQPVELYRNHHNRDEEVRVRTAGHTCLRAFVCPASLHSKQSRKAEGDLRSHIRPGKNLPKTLEKVERRGRCLVRGLPVRLAGFYPSLSKLQIASYDMKFKIAVSALAFCILLAGPVFGAGERYVYGESIGRPLENVAQIGMKSQIWYMFVTSLMLFGFFCLAHWLDAISDRIKDRLRK
jgi:hypothetical protein